MIPTIEKWSLRTILFFLCLLPVLIYGATQLPVGEADVHEWLPSGLPEKVRYEKFQERFGNDQFLIVSWPGCQVDDPRLDAFRQHLLPAESSSPRLIKSVQDTREVLDELTDPQVRLTEKGAKARLQGFLIGKDGTAASILRFTQHGIAHQRESMTFVFAAADAVPNLGRDQLRMAGTLYEAYAVDDAAGRSLKQLVIPSSLMGILLAWGCLRSVRGAVAVLIIAGVGQLTAVAFVYFTGGVFSAVLVVLPTLIFMLTLSGAVHLMNYYHDVAMWHDDHWGCRAMLLGFKPSLLASLTTSLGMASLALSQLAPVKEFGLYSAVTLTLATFFLLMSFPRISDWFCQRSMRRSLPHRHPEAASSLEPADDIAITQVVPLAARYAQWMQDRAIFVTAIGLFILGISFYGLLSLKSSNKFAEMFPSDSPTVRDLRFIEERIGPIASVEVMMHFPTDSTIDVFDQALWVDRVARDLREHEDVGAVMSAVSFLPPLPKTASLRDVTRRSALRQGLEEHSSQLANKGWMVEEAASRVWRITAKVSAMSKADYGTLTSHVKEAVEQSLRDHKAPAELTLEYTGLSPLIHETQQMLLKDLSASFTAAFLLITPVMMLIGRGFWAGLLIMIPNVLPETLVFGTMAWMGFRLDVAGLLTASVAMGIAVNDTLHFMNWYAKRLQLGDSRQAAIAHTMSHCAVAMVHTMLISCCSMLPFLLADFNPTRQFAFLMIAMIGSSILGDLVLLPALLLGPLGKCLMPKKISQTPQPT